MTHHGFMKISFVTKPNQSQNCDGTGKSAGYRFWNSTVQHHFYTMNTSEKDLLIATNPKWNYEGIAFCADASAQSDTTPVYRFYSKSKGGHFYTINETEKNSLIANDPSWSFEGIAYYASK